MSKKNKNYVAGGIIVLLLACLCLTVYFAKSDTTNTNMFDKFESNNRDDNSRSLPSDFDKSKIRPDVKQDSTSKENVEESTEEITTSENKDNSSRKSTRRNFGQSNNEITRPSNMNINRGYASKYVILIGFETFLLGGSIMYLIMNNIEKEETKKEKK